MLTVSTGEKAVNTIQVQFVSASRRSGISKKSGAKYDMCNLAYALPLEAVDTQNMTFAGHGFEVMEINLSPEKIGDFAGLELGQQIEVALSADPRNANRNICIGLA